MARELFYLTKQRVCSLLQSEGDNGADVEFAGTDVGLELAGLCLPGMGGLVVELEVLEGDAEVNGLGLAGGEGDLLEALQLLDRTVNVALVVADIQLDYLLALTLAYIAHRD